MIFRRHQLVRRLSYLELLFWLCLSLFYFWLQFWIEDRNYFEPSKFIWNISAIIFGTIYNKLEIMSFGKEMKRLREEANMSVQKIADMIGVNADRWRKWEEKDLKPRMEDGIIIEAFFGMGIRDLTKLESIKEFLKVPIVQMKSEKDDKPHFITQGSVVTETKTSSTKLDQSDRDLLSEISINQKATLQYLREIRERLDRLEGRKTGTEAVREMKDLIKKGKASAEKDKHSNRDGA